MHIYLHFSETHLKTPFVKSNSGKNVWNRTKNQLFCDNADKFNGTEKVGIGIKTNLYYLFLNNQT